MKNSYLLEKYQDAISTADKLLAQEKISDEMKLEAITLDKLTEYLHLIENPEQLIFIKRISLTDNKREKGHLDSILQVLTFK